METGREGDRQALRAAKQTLSNHVHTHLLQKELSHGPPTSDPPTLLQPRPLLLA